MKILTIHQSRRPTALIAALLTLLVFGFGCERTPEDLEEWRTAQGGMTQLAEWAQDESNSMEVRIRAIQIMIEEGASDQVPRTLDGIDDDEERQTIADAAVPTIEEMWGEQDFPELTEEMKEEGAQVPIEDFVAVRAVDAAYRIHPHLGDDAQRTIEDILQAWISDDQELRTQLADTSIPVLLSRAGDGAIEGVTDWILTAYDPREVATSLRNHAPDNAHETIDAAVAERARDEHPDLSEDMMFAIDGATSDGIVSYLEEAIVDEAMEQEFIQVAIDTLGDIGTDKAVAALSKLVAEQPGLLRWASANALVDARGVAGLVDIATALPDDTDAYADLDDGELHRYISQVCSYVNTHLDRGDIDADPDAIKEVLTMDRWPAQVLGLQCAGATDTAAVRADVQALSDESTTIPAWGEDRTVGQFAGEVDSVLGDGDED